MSTPLIGSTPEPPKPERSLALKLLQAIGLLLLMAIVSAAASYGVFAWRIQSEQAAATAELTALREQTLSEVASLKAELKAEQSQLQAQLKQVEEAAAATGLLLQQEGELTGLQTKLAEVETLKLDLRKTQEDLETRLQELEKSVLDKVAQSGQETAQALSLEMRFKSLIIKAQGEVLLAQLHWTEGNRGLAKDELAIASRSLQQAQSEAPEAARPAIQKVVAQAEQTRAALILEQASSRDALNLLWHQVSDLLATNTTSP